MTGKEKYIVRRVVVFSATAIALFLFLISLDKGGWRLVASSVVLSFLLLLTILLVVPCFGRWADKLIQLERDKKEWEIIDLLKGVAKKHSVSFDFIYVMFEVLEKQGVIQEDLWLKKAYHKFHFDKWNYLGTEVTSDIDLLLKEVDSKKKLHGDLLYEVIEEGFLDEEDVTILKATAERNQTAIREIDLAWVLYEKQEITEVLNRYSENSLSAFVKKHLYNDLIPLVDMYKAID